MIKLKLNYNKELNMKRIIHSEDERKTYTQRHERYSLEDIEQIKIKLNKCGKLGEEVAKVINLLNNDSVLFSTLNKDKQIGYMYACVISIQASIELLHHPQSTQKRETIRQIQVQLQALRGFIHAVRRETFAKTEIQTHIEKIFVLINTMMVNKYLESQKMMKSLRNLKA